MNFTRTVPNPIDYNFNPRSVAIGDFNNDTWLDFVTTDHTLNDISVFLQFTNNTFRKSTTYSTGVYSLPNAVAIADLNNDQQLDIVVACFGSNNIGIFLGVGDSTFVNRTTISSGLSRPLWIHIAHLDNDNYLDLAIANFGTNHVGNFLERVMANSQIKNCSQLAFNPLSELDRRRSF